MISFVPFLYFVSTRSDPVIYILLKKNRYPFFFVIMESLVFEFDSAISLGDISIDNKLC